MKRAQDAQTILLRCIGKSHKNFPYFNPSDHFTQGHFIFRTFIIESNHTPVYSNVEVHYVYVNLEEFDFIIISWNANRFINLK